MTLVNNEETNDIEKKIKELREQRRTKRQASSGETLIDNQDTNPFLVKTPPANLPHATDDYIQKQEEGYRRISSGAATIHRFITLALSFLRTFFQRSILGVVGVLILLTGMILSAEAYCISAGVLPGSLIPKPGVSIGDAKATWDTITTTFQFIDWLWLVVNSALAVLVQSIQWSLVKVFRVRSLMSKYGVSSGMPGFLALLFYAFCGFMWFTDLSIVSSLYMAAGFSLTGFLIWIWAAFPSELCEAFFVAQKMLPEHDS
jgi:hypothetical protein